MTRWSDSLVQKTISPALRDETREIISDNRWAGSKRGAASLAINDWHQPFHPEFRPRPAFEQVCIGGHSERLCVFVTRTVATRAEHDALFDYVTAKNPPFKRLTDIRIAEES